VAVGQCTNGTSNECQTGSDCSGEQVCCAGLPSPDASTSGGGLLGALNLAMLDTTCQATCLSTQQQQCASDGECPSGETCQQPAAAGGFGGGVGGGLGGGLVLGAGSTDAGADGGGFMIAKVCAVPVADGGSGTPGSGTTPDAGATVDSGTTLDSGAVDVGDSAVPQ
jgi:hypothetical protein